MVFEGTTECINVFIISIPNEKERKICEFETDLNNFFFDLNNFSEIGSGFGERGVTAPQRIPRSTPRVIS